MNLSFILSPGAGRHATRPRIAARCAGSFWRVVLMVGTVLAGGSQARATDQQVSKEYQIKAAFLYNFTKFVEWPSERFADSTSPIVIGVLGENPFGGELAKIVKDRKVNGREIVVRNLATAAEAGAVHVIFVGVMNERDANKIGLTFRTAGVLSVGESAPFLARGGIIGFVVETGKVRFEINQDAAERAGLKVSAQLLKLAAVVRRKT